MVAVVEMCCGVLCCVVWCGCGCGCGVCVCGVWLSGTVCQVESVAGAAHLANEYAGVLKVRCMRTKISFGPKGEKLV